jgi:hypothetical protein
MEINHNVIGWFEVPVIDMDRAIKFYETLFGFKLTRNIMGDLDMAFFPWVDNGIGSGGALVCYSEFYKPSTDGVVIYFTAFSGDLSYELALVEPNGGKIIMEKKQISEKHGFMAVFIDTEGNRIALHSGK